MEAKKIFTQRNKPILTEMKNHPCFPKPPEFAGMVWLTYLQLLLYRGTGKNLCTD